MANNAYVFDHTGGTTGKSGRFWKFQKDVAFDAPEGEFEHMDPDTFEVHKAGYRTDAQAPAPSAAELDEAKADEKAKAQTQAHAKRGSVDATDSAKELAGKHGIDLKTVEGTGAGGRIVKSDVEKLVLIGDDTSPDPSA